ncbi:hypothetical protein ACN38_g4941 [Penicillium nordicum]|uniref:Uncharacterized protein n=1 Tax=Penicillium nordicum TaxID=229535 RepID=A0A0M9WGT1_9EURO|nr:hypothetical protein ACN38_g4941 [Penicillium nordicum]
MCRACYDKASKGREGESTAHKVSRVAFKLQLESMNRVTFHCGTPNCAKMMPPWPPIGYLVGRTNNRSGCWAPGTAI